MNPEFKDCLKKQRIKEFSRGKALVNKELKTSGVIIDPETLKLNQKGTEELRKKKETSSSAGLMTFMRRRFMRYYKEEKHVARRKEIPAYL